MVPVLVEPPEVPEWLCGWCVSVLLAPAEALTVEFSVKLVRTGRSLLMVQVTVSEPCRGGGHSLDEHIVVNTIKHWI